MHKSYLLQLQFLKQQMLMLLLLVSVLPGCQGQKTNKKIIGGGCDGCEIMFIDIPTNIKAVDTSAGWTEQGQKLVITGLVYKIDGKTPVKDAIIYYWQTDNNGYYSPRPGMTARAKPHGHIRGWIKTGADGRYSIYTIRPSPYPGRAIPAHIHIAVKEPLLANEYYIDDLEFEDDELLNAIERSKRENRGGSGILKLLLKDNVQMAEHNIVLGLNIPDYPGINTTQKNQGL